MKLPAQRIRRLAFRSAITGGGAMLKGSFVSGDGEATFKVVAFSCVRSKRDL